MSTPRHRQLDILSNRLDRAATIVPTILDHLDEQRAHVSYLAASTTDTSHGSGISDPTGRTVEHYSHIEYRRTAITDAISVMNTCTNMLEEACRDALATRATSDHTAVVVIDKPRCIGDGTPDGAICTQIPIRRTDLHTSSSVDDGRCLDCGPRWDTAENQRRLDSDARRHRRYSARQSAQVDGVK